LKAGFSAEWWHLTRPLIRNPPKLACEPLSARVLRPRVSCQIAEKSVDDPTVLADPSAAGEPVALHSPATEPGDLLKCACKSNASNAAMAMASTNEEACDPPVWGLPKSLSVGLLVLDPRQLLGRSELAPPNALRAFEHKRGMRQALANPRLLESRRCSRVWTPRRPSAWKFKHQQPDHTPW
jgi:hypothetical protein